MGKGSYVARVCIDRSNRRLPAAERIAPDPRLIIVGPKIFGAPRRVPRCALRSQLVTGRPAEVTTRRVGLLLMSVVRRVALSGARDRGTHPSVA